MATENKRREQQGKDVIGEWVWCSLQKKHINIDACFYCPFLESIDLDHRKRTLTCHSNGLIAEEDREAYAFIRILNVAELYGNVNQVCREMGITRYQFYKYKRIYERQGLAGLKAIQKLF